MVPSGLIADLAPLPLADPTANDCAAMRESCSGSAFYRSNGLMPSSAQRDLVWGFVYGVGGICCLDLEGCFCFGLGFFCVLVFFGFVFCFLQIFTLGK